ncbi:uncharacterized protein LOC123534880 [Mercenaria mercenaria]|uniref:uncharacterized protein LOC123534880 n=1 Tax=Mercenaria mercenaria TaxID=6596 RepID=UPI00234E7732|nr:uncharacterized protein LOC123534880 [Mercenaria mercenaria]
MSQPCKENFSSLLCTTLDTFGYSHDIKNARVYTMEKLAESLSKQATSKLRLITNSDIRLTSYIVGSRSEGVTNMFQSDFDVMSVLNEFVCVDTPCEERNLCVFKPEYKNSPPGYVRLIAKFTEFNDLTPGIYISEQNEMYFSSVSLTKLLLNTHILRDNILPTHPLIQNVVRSSVGPSINKTFDLSFAGWNSKPENDSVFAIYMYTSNISKRWSSGAGRNGWPSQELVNEITSIEGFLVPVGEKESENELLEWRISYVTTEKKLLCSLNSTQNKLYALLKMISKEVIKPNQSGISSYMMKNIVLWMADRNSSSLFVPSLMVDRIMQSLNFLKVCLLNNHLPNYLIPERNLLAGRITSKTKEPLIDSITALLEEGKGIFSRIPKIAKCFTIMLNFRESALAYGKWRDQVEKKILELVVFEMDNDCDSPLHDVVDESTSRPQYHGILLQLIILIFPDLFSQYLQNSRTNITETVVQRFKMIFE